MFAADLRRTLPLFILLASIVLLPAFAGDQILVTHSKQAEKLLADHKLKEASQELIEVFKLLPASTLDKNNPETKKIFFTELPSAMMSLSFQQHYLEAEILGKWAFSSAEKKFGSHSPITYMTLNFLSTYCYCQVLNHIPNRQKTWEDNNQKMKAIMAAQSPAERSETTKLIMSEMARVSRIGN